MSQDRARSSFSSHPSECRLRIVLIGNSGVGKSSFMNKLVDDNFDINFLSTIGVDFKKKILEIDGKTVELQIWDTAGQERFLSVSPLYCRNANGTILLYDITDIKSFEAITFWADQFSEYAPTEAVAMLLGNKMDLRGQRVVSKDMGIEAGRRLTAPFFEISAATGENIDVAVEAFTRAIVNGQGYLTLQASLDTPPAVSGNKINVRMEGARRNSLTILCCNKVQDPVAVV